MTRVLRQRGMTLLEMIIGLLLLSMLLMLLFGGLQLASQSWDRGTSFTDNVSQMQLAQSFLRREIASVFPFRIRASTNQPNDLFLGYEAGPTSLQFVAPMPAAGARGGLYTLRVGLATVPGPHGDDHALVLWRAPVGLPLEDGNSRGYAGAADPANAPVTLVDHVRDAKFSYYGTPAGATQPAWYDNWPDASQAPRLVRLHVALDNGHVWPDLIVAPRIDMRAAARF